MFGEITNLDTLAPDCSNVQVTGGWDPLRPEQDPSGYIDDFLGRLPEANNYDIDPGSNIIEKTRFSLPEAMALLYSMDIILDDPDNDW